MKEYSPLISIIMPAYNAQNTILESILSVISQSYPCWELLVVDDKSNDNTVDIVRKLAEKDNRIKLFVLEKNSGSPAAPRNHALQKVKGEYIAFLDADDSWLENKLNAQLSYMLANNVYFSYTSYYVTDSKGILTGIYEVPESVSYIDLLKENYLGCLTVMVKAEVLKNRSFKSIGHEDYALWLDIMRCGHIKAYGVRTCLAKYRVLNGSVSSNKLKVLGFFWNIYRNCEGFSFFKSAFYCMRYAWNAKNKYALTTTKHRFKPEV